MIFLILFVDPSISDIQNMYRMHISFTRNTNFYKQNQFGKRNVSEVGNYFTGSYEP